MSISIRLDEGVLERLEQLTTRTGRSKSYYIREAILTHLDDLEDVYLAERELEEVRAGRSSLTPLEDVMKAYGMAD